MRLSPASQRTASRLFQAGIAVLLGVGVVLGNLAVVVNAALALAVTFLPALVRRDWQVHLGPALSLWVTVAVFLHVVGMLGLYVSTTWFDHVTHLFSAALVAAVGYSVIHVVDRHSEDVFLPPEFRFVFIVLFTLAAGVLWELLEFAARYASILLGTESPLIQYGPNDTMLDLVFDAAGAVLVGALGQARLGAAADAVLEQLRDG